MSVQDVINQFGILEVVHFTTHRGLMGSLHSNCVKSRKRLPREQELRFIYKPNADIRKDKAWLDYVNLSISRINGEFFGHSCRWARFEDLWWCVLSFDPIILTHPGVYFTTTNNIYPSCSRGTGADALRALYNATVSARYGRRKTRQQGMRTDWTTCEQAEVLYPEEVSLDYLRRIYVASGEDQDEVYGQLAAMGWRKIEVELSPEKFSGHTGD